MVVTKSLPVITPGALLLLTAGTWCEYSYNYEEDVLRWAIIHLIAYMVTVLLKININPFIPDLLSAEPVILSDYLLN